MRITWKKEETVLNTVRSDRYEVLETITHDGMKSEMVIRSVDRSDSGLYLCTGENTFGLDERTNKVIVMEPPGAPSNLEVRESWSRSGSISWTPPTSGNSPILAYIIQHWAESVPGENLRLEEEEVSGSQTSFMLRDLRPDSSYRVSVLAVNQLGRGQGSDPVTFKTGEEEPSAPPLDVMVESKGPTTIRVVWKAPPRESWHGSLIGYYVGFRHVNNYSKAYSLRSVPALSSNSSMEYFLSGLAKASEYAVVVKAYNKAGSGPESAQLVAKTLSGSLPPAPKLYLFSITHDSLSINAKMSPGDVTGTIGELSGFSIHYRRDEDLTWTEIGIPVSTGKDGGEYVYGML